MKQTDRYYAGLDIGGTSVKAVLLHREADRAGAVVEVDSHVKDGYQATFSQLEVALDQLAAAAGISRSQVAAVGLDIPAASSKGVIWERANLGDDWVCTDVRSALAERLGVPVTTTNDCNAAAMGEYVLRKHSGCLMLVAPGTGLGGGLILEDGRIYEGANGLALEVGHASVPFREEDGTLPDCTCGQKGCAEAWVSLLALRRRLSIELAKPQWAAHPLQDPALDIARKAYRLRDHAARGDELAVSIFKQQARILGYVLAYMAIIRFKVPRVFRSSRW